ncbi:MAG: flagellar basal body P-ring protein FlgI [Nannocystaceae bacterium]
MALLIPRITSPRLVQSFVALLGFIACLLSASPAHADRIKELASIRGVAENSLVGYGLVVGLAGTGDDLQSEQTKKMVSNVLSRQFGTMVTPNDIRARNVAVVMVTARMPAFSTMGRRIDVTVSSASNAKSLFGGTLLPTALKSGNGAVFAWAEGPLSIGGFSASGGSGSSVTKNHPTVGRVPSGAVVARELDFKMSASEPITIALKDPDFTTAARMAHAINDRLGAPVAKASNPSTVQVAVPESQKSNLVGLIATIENIQVTPDQRARIIINERTGTIVMGSHVRISPVAISHGSLTVQISEQQAVSQPDAPLTDGQTVTTQQTDIEVIEEGGDVRMLSPGPTLGDVVNALNTLGVKPRDLVAILMAMQQAGAVQADIEVQ